MVEEIFVHLSCPHCASVIERYLVVAAERDALAPPRQMLMR